MKDKEQLGVRMAKYKEPGGRSVQTMSIDGHASGERARMGERKEKSERRRGARADKDESRRDGEEQQGEETGWGRAAATPGGAEPARQMPDSDCQSRDGRRRTHSPDDHRAWKCRRGRRCRRLAQTLSAAADLSGAMRRGKRRVSDLSLGAVTRGRQSSDTMLVTGDERQTMRIESGNCFPRVVETV